MARSVGIPARLATGFVPGSRDSLTGQFIVRERDAHAWAEIYFPGVGWQPFDPTASVPLAGDATTSGSWMQAARHHALELGLVAAVLVLLALGAPELLTRLRRSAPAAERVGPATVSPAWSASAAERAGPGTGRDAARLRGGAGGVPARRTHPYGRRHARRRRILSRRGVSIRAPRRRGAILALTVKGIP